MSEARDGIFMSMGSPRLAAGLFAVLFCLFPLFGCSDSPPPERDGVSAQSLDTSTGPLVVRIYYANIAEISTYEFDVLEYRNPREGYVLALIPSEDRERLEASSLRYEIDFARTQSFRNPAADFSLFQDGGIPGFSCYRTVSEGYARAQELTEVYPSLARWIDVGDSWEKISGNGGHDLHILRLTNEATPGPKPALVLTASIHAREYTPAELALRFAESLLEGYGEDADATWFLDHQEIHVMFQANPDGRIYAQAGQYWRKNGNRDHCGRWRAGVDLNRNFDFAWDCCGGSSGRACSETFRGPSAASEPETVAIRDYLVSVFPDQRGPGLTEPAPADASGVYIDIHSFSELVLWPWGFDDEAPNAAALRTLGEALARFNGYDPQPAVELYPTDGTTIDFAYGELGVAAMVFELGTEFFQSCAVFEQTILPDNLAALRYAARVARAPYLLPAGPNVVALSRDAGAITATVRSADGVEALAEAWATLGAPPWADDAPPPLPLTAVDGSFDSAQEGVRMEMPATDARQLLYVQGRDAQGRVGPVSAVFIEPAAD